jgi:drug/metabolite transporter (DMT)-like permease
MKTRIWLALIAVYIAWGTTYLAIRFAVETIPPFIMAGTRFLMAGFILFSWRRLAGDHLPTSLQWRSAGIIGSFLLVGGIGVVSWAEQRVPSGITALLVASAPLWMVVIDAVRPRGIHTHWLTTVGVFVGLSGIVILVGPSLWSTNDLDLALPAVGALILASFLWAIGSLYSRKAELPASPLMGTGMEMLAGSAGLFVMATITGEWGRLDPGTITLRSLLGLAYLILIGSLVGFAAYTWLLRVAPTPLVSTYAYVNPLIAVLVGSLLAGETLIPRVVLAAGIIVSAVAIINMGRSRMATAAPGRLELAPSAAED